MHGSIGYESNRSASELSERTLARNIHTDIIKVLPFLLSYETSERMRMKISILNMLKSCGSVWMLRNELRAAQPLAPGKDHQWGTTTPQATTATNDDAPPTQGKQAHAVVHKQAHAPQVLTHAAPAPASAGPNPAHELMAHEHNQAHEQTAHEHNPAHGLMAHEHNHHDHEDPAASSIRESNLMDQLRSVTKHSDATIAKLEARYQASEKKMSDMRTAQASELHELRERLHSTHFPPSASLEPWVTEAILEKDLAVTHRWWHIEACRYEDSAETQLRHRIYTHIIDRIPPELHNHLIVGDVKGAYCNIIAKGTKEASVQATALLTKLRNITKLGKSMMRWLDELRDICERLNIRGHSTDTNTLRVHIYDSLGKDLRYDGAVRDIKRHPFWTMEQIRYSLESVATEINDLLTPVDPSATTSGISTTTGTGFKESSAKVLPIQASSQLKGRGKVSKSPSDEELLLLGQETCLRYQRGTCPYGHLCRRAHVSISEQDTTTLATRVSERQQCQNSGYCYTYATDGTCTLGSHCRYKHSSPTQKKVLSGRHQVHRRGKQATTEPANLGDVVILTQSCPVPSLRGCLGQIHNIQGDRTTLPSQGGCKPLNGSTWQVP